MPEPAPIPVDRWIPYLEEEHRFWSDVRDKRRLRMEAMALLALVLVSVSLWIMLGMLPKDAATGEMARWMTLAERITSGFAYVLGLRAYLTTYRYRFQAARKAQGALAALEEARALATRIASGERGTATPELGRAAAHALAMVS